MKNKLIKLVIFILISYLCIIIFAISTTKLLFSSSTGIYKYDPNEKYFLSFNCKKMGNFSVKINSVILLDRNNHEMQYENEYFRYKFYIDQDGKIGAIINNPNLIKKVNLYEVNNYCVNSNDFNLILEYYVKKTSEVNNLSTIKISYRVLGVKKVTRYKISSFEFRN